MLEGKNEPIMNFDGFDAYFDAEAMTSINLGDIVGEAANVSRDLAKIGYWRGLCSAEIEECTIRASIREAHIKHEIRNSVVNGMCTVNGSAIKYSEKAIENAHKNDAEWMSLVDRMLKAKGDWSNLDAIYWGVHSKDKKLDKFLPKLNMDENGNVVEYRNNY